MQSTFDNESLGQKQVENGKSNLVTGLLVLLIKGKTLLLGLVKLKYFATVITAVISVFCYAGRFGWAGAIGFVGLIFVHEMGHALMLRHYKVPASVPMFIPFLGAFIGMKGYPKGVREEAYVALAGPVLGSIGALACFATYFATGNHLWAWLAYIGFFLNLFNLLPMSPLDGGRVVAAVWRGFWILGVIAAVALANFLESPVLLLFAVFGLDEINRRFTRVHWLFYWILAGMALVSSIFFNEFIWGIVIAVVAVSHGMKVQDLQKREESAGFFVITKAPLGHVANPSENPTPLTTYGVRVSCSPNSDGIRISIWKPGKEGLLKQTWREGWRVERKFSGPGQWFPVDISKVGAAGCQGKKISRLRRKTSLSNLDSIYFGLPRSQRILIGSVYVGLAGTLSGAVWWMHQAGLFSQR